MADDTVIAAKSSTTSSQPLEMAVTNIAADGDVIFNLEHKRLRVSSVILSSASPVFKVMLGPNFLEGQDVRSAQQPKEIPLLEDDSLAMTRLCFLLHHQRDPKDPSTQDIDMAVGVQDLFSLVALADKYGCIDAVWMAGSSLLSYFAYSSISTGMSIEALLHLIGTAYILEDDRQFALFTRRLVMDYTATFSKVAAHPAMATLPSLFLCGSASPCKITIGANNGNNARGGTAKSRKHAAS